MTKVVVLAQMNRLMQRSDLVYIGGRIDKEEYMKKKMDKKSRKKNNEDNSALK